VDPIGSVNGLVIDCADPIALARFWSAMFATEIDSIEDDPPRYVDLRARSGLPVLRFQRVPEAKTVKNRLHLDIEVDSLDAAVARVQALGGRPAQERGTDFGWHFRIMADPEGNEFCLIEQAAGRDGVTLSPR
jgi:predicted enzyme related to lactoylglutathione lyase